MDDAPTKRRLVKLVVRAEGQAALETLMPGVPVTLSVRPDEDDQPPAVLVAAADGAALGVLATADAAALAPFIDGDRLGDATLHHLTGGTAEHPGHEAWIGLRWQGQEARMPVPLTAAQRAWRERGETPEAPKRRRFAVKSRPARDGTVTGDTTVGGRLRRALAAYMSGQLTWKATLIGIVISTLAMTTFLILFGSAG